MSTTSPSPSLIESTVAGLLAGVASTLVAHPLDVIKTRLQGISRSERRSATAKAYIKSRFPVDRGSQSATSVLRTITRNEGGIRGLYRGVAVNILGNSISWALYFAWYESIKDGIGGSRGSLSYYDYFLASGAAGALTALCTNPIWVIKTRMLSTSSTHPGAYTSILDGTRQIFRSEGLRGYYRGLLPSLIGVSHGALQFMAYEQLKIYRANGIWEKQKDLGAVDYLVLSGLAKLFAGSITYPYQVVRARLQMYDADSAYTSARDVVGQVWRKEGLAGYYKGLGANMLRVMPSTWVTFLVYEKTRSFFVQDVRGPHGT